MTSWKKPGDSHSQIKSVMIQSNADSLPSSSRRRSHSQSYGPERGEQGSAAGKRLSLVRSNAVSRKQGSVSSPRGSNDEPDFSYLPAHWTHTVKPNMPTSSDVFTFLRRTRAERDQHGASKCACNAREISVPSTDSGQQSQNPPCLVCEGLSTKYARLPISKQDDSLGSKVVTGVGSFTANVGQHQDTESSHDSRQQSSKLKPYPDIQALGSRVEALEKELEDQKALLRTLLDDDGSDASTKDFSTMAGELKTQLQDFKRLLSSLGPALCTRRGVMVLKAMQHQQKERPKSVCRGGNGVGGFDDVLSIREVTDISQALDTRPDLLGTKSTCIRVCAVCNIPRFVRVLSFHTTSLPGRRSEFPSDHSTTQCCRESICDSCFIPGLVANFADGWWSGLGLHGWLKCAISGCQSVMPIFYQQQLRDLLQQLGDKEGTLHEAQFARCLRLRDVLSRLDPRPTADALRTAAALHRRLIDWGWMEDPSQVINFFDVDSTAISIQVVSVDTLDGTETLKVPIFVDNLIRKASRDCIVCTESRADIAASEEEEERWSAAIQGFPGDWTEQIRPFPSQSVLAVCATSHALDICRSCLSKHIKAHLDSRGMAGCESLTCPHPDCGHHFTHEEVRMLATPEVFARYDKLKLLSVLSTDADFRWCLREGCEMGQIYQILDQLGDGPSDRRRNHVECEECGFEMCFKHQIPWHRGLSCVEYDRMKASMANDDNNDEATQEWLLWNTKICRCGAYVEKKGGCFHMKCSSCLFEFCWECMADWKEIQGRGFNGGYNRLAHAPGCWFRLPTSSIPTQLRGDTLEDALQRFRD